ncbi:MAG: MBL fold metallo-hydrolase [Lentisphaeria bacterium]|jgi:ribonuclease BN (tRNA processing enzyme)|nr:MBL fold metallo-hydrolase [Lentisphaeria bacterium]
MKITTLGSSHGDATATRNNSAILLEIESGAYLFEVGEPVCTTLIRREFDFGRLRAVFVSHMHGDHAGGLPILLKFFLKYRKPGWRCEVRLPETEAIPGLQAWMQALHLPNPEGFVDFAGVAPGLFFADGQLRVTALPTQHFGRTSPFPSYGYLIEAEGKRVLFTGDLSGDFHDFPALPEGVADVDLCLSEATHAPLAAIVTAISSAPIRRLVLTHIGPRWDGGHEPELAAAFASHPFPTHIARDGDEFTL